MEELQTYSTMDFTYGEDISLFGDLLVGLQPVLWTDLKNVEEDRNQDVTSLLSPAENIFAGNVVETKLDLHTESPLSNQPSPISDNLSDDVTSVDEEGPALPQAEDEEEFIAELKKLDDEYQKSLFQSGDNIQTVSEDDLLTVVAAEEIDEIDFSDWKSKSIEEQIDLFKLDEADLKAFDESAFASEQQKDPDYRPIRSSRRVQHRRTGSAKDRKERKKEQNKAAALRYREKKKAEQSTVEDEAADLEARNQTLRDSVDSMTREIAYLKELMVEVYKVRGTTLKKMTLKRSK